MSRRNPEEEQETPGQETPETEEEQEIPENPEEQEQDPETEEQPEGEQEDTPEDQEEDPQEQPPADSGSDETAALRRELMRAQSRLAAHTAGVAPAMIDDAVTLAMAEAARAGEVTEASVRTAMEAVLKRHPEWKAQEEKRGAGGFRLGGDRDAGSGRSTQNQTKNQKRWNRFK